MVSDGDRPVVLEIQPRFQTAVRNFRSEYFWWCDPACQVTTVTTAREAIHQLRQHG